MPIQKRAAVAKHGKPLEMTQRRSLSKNTDTDAFTASFCKRHASIVHSCTIAQGCLQIPDHGISCMQGESWKAIGPYHKILDLTKPQCP